MPGALTLHREPADLAARARGRAAQGAVAVGRRASTLASAGEPRLVTERRPGPVPARSSGTSSATPLRHTPAGGRVEVDVRDEAEDALLTVRDTGEGIAAEDLPRVFDRFQRRADTGGSGLGLAIVRDLAAAHGGP